MQKGFVQFIVLGVLGLIIVAVGAFYLGKQAFAPKSQSQNQVVTSQITPSPTASPVPTGTGETTNWKIYEDPYYNLTFKYPDSLEVYVGFNTPDQSVREIDIVDKNARGVINDIIELQIYAKVINIPSFYTGEIAAPHNSEPFYEARQMYSKLLDLEPKVTMQDNNGNILFTRLPAINISGITMAQYEGRRVSSAPFTTYLYRRGVILNRNDVLYAFFMGTQTTDSNMIPVKYFDQILSTFKFIN